MILLRKNHDERNSAVNGMLFERIITFKYLGVKISGDEDNHNSTKIYYSYLIDVSSS